MSLFSSSVKVQIPEPCQENWHEMTPQEQGRFCAHCQKCVVDFTGMSEKQIVRYFKQTEGEVCGRFNANQLNKPLKDPAIFRLPSAIKYALTSVLTFGTFSMAKAQEVRAKVEQREKRGEEAHSLKAEIIQDEVASDSIRIFGQVTDADEGYGLPGVLVRTSVLNQFTLTDLDGRYVMIVPVPVVESDSISFEFNGYSTQAFSLKDLLNQLALGDSLQLNILIEGAEYIVINGEKLQISEAVVGGAISVKPSLWHRFKNLFRRKPKSCEE